MASVLLAIGAMIFFLTRLSMPAAYVNFEGKQTNPIRLSPDGTRLFAVNTPDARLSVFDVTHPSNPFLIAEIPVGIEPASVNPRDNEEVWVVNEVSDSVSVVSVSQRIVMDTLYVKDEPADVAFAAGKAFVSASRNNRVSVFDLTSRGLLTNLALFGENPRALAVSPDGSNVYAAFALSGNRTTLIPVNNAPPQPTNATPPMKSSLPAPPQVGLIVDATDPAWTNIIRFVMPDNDVVEINAATLAISRYFRRVGTVNLGLAAHPVSGDLYVANTEARNLARFEPNVRGHTVDNRVSRIAIGSGAVTAFDLNPGVNYGLFPNLPALTNAVAQPTALAFDPGGSFLWVAAFGTDRVAKVDTNGNVLARIEVGPAVGSAADPRNKRGPRGLALNAGAQRLYVLNRLANTISIIDTATQTLLKEIPVGSFDPTPPVVRNGRGFLYDAKLSGNGTMACAACHIDAELDLISWDLGNPQGDLEVVTARVSALGVTASFTNHPMKGPMTTQPLRGLKTLDPFHWKGDRTNFLHFNVAFDGLMGGPPLSAADMAAYRDFINTVVFQPNPNQNLDRTLPTSLPGVVGDPRAGFTNFTIDVYQAGLSCNTCHTLPEGTDRSITPAAALQESQSFKVPHLRNVYQKLNLNRTPGASSIGGFGFLHDGTFADIFTFLSQPVFGLFQNNATIKNNLNAFLQCFDTGTAPAVGYTRTVTAANVSSPSLSNDWTLLENQAAATNIDLIGKGTLDGQLRGLRYQPASNTYQPDTTNAAPLTRSQLTAKIQAGDTLSLMGVPPGSGSRMGLDRDLDGVLDADMPPPTLGWAQAGAEVLISWPLGAAGFRLEATDTLSPATWATVTNAVEIIAGRNFVADTPSTTHRFYRLKFP